MTNEIEKLTEVKNQEDEIGIEIGIIDAERPLVVAPAGSSQNPDDEAVLQTPILMEYNHSDDNRDDIFLNLSSEFSEADEEKKFDKSELELDIYSVSEDESDGNEDHRYNEFGQDDDTSGFNHDVSMYPDDIEENELPFATDQQKNVSFLSDSSDIKKNPMFECASHLPFITKLPLRKKDSLKILSWNLKADEPVTENNLDTIGIMKQKSDLNVKHKQRACAIKGMVENKKPDIVVLQNVNINAFNELKGTWFNSKLYEMVGGDLIAADDDDSHQEILYDNVAFYRKKTVKSASIDKEAMNSTPYLFTLRSGYDARIASTYGVCCAEPDQVETAIAAFLNENSETNKKKPARELRVVIGSYAAELSKSPASSPQLTAMSDEREVRWIPNPRYVDGAFYKSITTKKLHQAKTVFLDPMKGRSLKPMDIKIPNKKYIEEDQKQLFSQMRPAINLDTCFQTMRLLNNEKLTVFQLQYHLRKRLNNESLGFRFSSDLYNHHGFTVWNLSEQQYKLLWNHFPSFPHREYVKPNGDTGYTASVLQADALQFIKALNALPLLEKLAGLPESQRDICTAVTQLITETVKDDQLDLHQSSDIFDYFVEPVDAVVQKRLLNKELMATNEKKMMKALHQGGRATQVAGYMAVGAVIGFAAGFSIAVGLAVGLGFGAGLIITLGVIAVFSSEISVIFGEAAGMIGHKVTTKRAEPSKGFEKKYNTAAKMLHGFFNSEEQKNSLRKKKNTNNTIMIPERNGSPSHSPS